MVNKYKVGKGAWNSWNDSGKNSFNEYYEYFKFNQELFLHPKGVVNSEEHWDTTAWNMAWSVADAVTKASSNV